MKKSIAVAGVALVMLVLSLGGETALAAPQLDVNGSCEPGAVRPGPALITCTVLITNTGDETAGNVRTSLGASANCNLPNPTIPALVYLYVDGVLQTDTTLPLSLQLGDLGPGESIETVTQIAVRNLSAGRVGAELGVTAQGVSRIETDLCWTIDPSALSPSTKVAVMKSLVSPPPGPPGFHPEAVYEIVVANSGTEPITALTLIDVIPPHLELGGSEPATNGSDGLGRPTWDLNAFGVSNIPPGDQVRVLVTLASPGDNCTSADNLAVAQSTVGGLLLDHVAFVDRTAQIGDCSQPEFCLYWAPGESNATEAPCDEPVCWSEAPDGDYYLPAYDCNADYCWFMPPGQGQAVLNPCEEEVCWLSFDEGGSAYYYDVSCDELICQYSAPDGSDSLQTVCDISICWSMPPEGGRWEPVDGCGEFGDRCWATPPGDGVSFLVQCGEQFCFAIPPPGAVTFGFSFPFFCEDVQSFCWPVSPLPGDFYTYPVNCTAVGQYCVAAPPGGGIAFIVSCGLEYCWEEIPDDFTPPPGVVIPPGLLVPQECANGETSTLHALSVPGEVVEGISTPAELVEGQVTEIEPAPSASVQPATLVDSVRVDTFPGPRPGPGPDDDDNTPPTVNNPPPDDDEPPDRIEDVLDLNKPPSNIGAPDSGDGYVEHGLPATWLAVAAALGILAVVCSTAGVVRRRS